MKYSLRKVSLNLINSRVQRLISPPTILPQFVKYDHIPGFEADASKFAHPLVSNSIRYNHTSAPSKITYLNTLSHQITPSSTLLQSRIINSQNRTLKDPSIVAKAATPIWQAAYDDMDTS
ncbi:hypothetical protein SeLEV6574_g06198 [Synchytrium endobioticum]|uniref:Uncharacterized protein n=1 Tax=Synchytrium endobioticum TaxID=286115 RepID=A0A507CQ17_9FUNG|nr:hypothetical protein SeLEV6574_g06198 [Synchytrium endobioticum]